MPPSAKEPRLVIAVDFGTTFTGVAYVFSEDSENVEVINDWPGSGNRTSDKVPTELLYQDAESGIVHLDADGKRQHQWGYGINLEGRKNAESLKWFKLLLHDKSPLFHGGSYEDLFGVGSHANPLAALLAALSLPAEETGNEATNNTPAAKTAAQLKQLRISPVEVASDYLRSVREHVISYLKDDFSRNSDSAKALTLEAAKKAGFGEYETQFNLIGEPEAAAAYTLKAIQPNKLNEGDTFVVCDAGGGTVDLVSYKIDKLDPLVVKEAVGGSGSLCGSVFVNDQFEKYVRELLGESVVNKMRPVAKREMMRQWEERVKFKFSDSEDIESFEVYIPGVPDNETIGLEGGFLLLSRTAVRSIFDPVIDKIVDLVDDQIRNVRKKGGKIAAILLVGGFGASEYLRKRLREQIFFGGTVEVMQPRNAWSAITRGALIRGLDGSFVTEMIARRHYGISVEMEYEPGKGLEAFRTWCPVEERWKVTDQMKWIVDKGMVIGDNKRVAMPIYGIIDEFSTRQVGVELLACEDDARPSWEKPLAVFPVCHVTADLSALPFDRFDVFRNSMGKRFWRVHCWIETNITSGMVTFSLMFEGKNYGKVESKFH
ncbi:hypothetical protein RUND412_001158 [Rhizina undulata]